MATLLEVEVVYHRPDFMFAKTIEVASGSTVTDVVEQSGLLDACPELAGNIPALGVFGKVVSDQYEVAAGDRIEVYRALVFDPKEARRKRAQEAAKKKPSSPKRSD